MFAPARDVRTEAEGGKAPIVPAGSVTGRSLTLVISIMCFLACLTAGAVYMMNQSADRLAARHRQRSHRPDRAEGEYGHEKLVADVTGFLTQQPGMPRVRALSVDDSARCWSPGSDNPTC